MVRDLQLQYTPDQLEVAPWDREKIHEVFDRLEFAVLRDRLFATLTSSEPEADEGFDVQGEVIETGRLGAWLDEHAGPGARHALTVVAPHRVHGTDAEAVAFAAADGAGGYVRTTALAPEDEEALGAWLADESRAKALHDGKWAIHALRGRGWTLAGVTSDTVLAAYLLRPGQRKFDLEDLSLRYLHRELRADDADGDDQQMALLDAGGSADPDSDATALRREAQAQMLRARATLDLAAAFDAELDAIEGAPLLSDIELPMLFVLADLEAAGIAVDADHMHDLRSAFAARVTEAADAAYAANDGEQINLGSPKQLQTVLFDKLDMPKTKRTKTGYTTDADALQSLFEK